VRDVDRHAKKASRDTDGDLLEAARQAKTLLRIAEAAASMQAGNVSQIMLGTFIPPS
jgi:hypothetical protein